MRTQNLPIQKARTTSEIINAASGYLVANAKSLFTSIGSLALPLFLLSTLISYTLTENRNSLEMVFHYKKSLGGNSFLLLVFCFILFVFGLCIFNLVVNKNLSLNDSSEEKEKVSYDGIKKDLGEELRNYILNFLIIYAIYFGVKELLGFALAQSGIDFKPSVNSGLGVMGYYLESITLYLPTLIVLSICFYFGLSSLFISYRDQIGATDALQKVWQVTQKNPKKALFTGFLLLFIVYLLHILLLIAFNFLEFAFLYPSPNTSLIFISEAVQISIDCILFIFFQVGIIILYGSIEDETEGHYIKSKIEEL